MAAPSSRAGATRPRPLAGPPATSSACTSRRPTRTRATAAYPVTPDRAHLAARRSHGRGTDRYQRGHPKCERQRHNLPQTDSVGFMTVARTPANITQADLARAIRAAKQTGAAEVEVRIGNRSVLIIRISPSTGTKAPGLEQSAEIVL